MGINTGEAIIGNIGSLGKKIEFTDLGDSINVASRLEGITKLYGTSLCISKSTHDAVKDLFLFRKLDTLYLKGKAEATEIYELVDFIEKASNQKKQLCKEYGQALDLYTQGNIEEARKLFADLADIYSDKPALYMKKRCEKLTQEGLPANWKGVWEVE